MKKVPLVFITLTLLFLFSVPEKIRSNCRYFLVSSFVPTWQKIHPKKIPKDSKKIQDVLSELELENLMLKNQIKAVQEWLLFDKRVDDLMDKWSKLSGEQGKNKNLYWQDFFYRRAQELNQLLQMQMKAIPAAVIFREPSSWSSSVWIDVGEKDNQQLNHLIVAENSPVVVGHQLIGIVEEVYQNKSRVRLLTDSRLVPAVRAVRGKKADSEVFEILDLLKKTIAHREDLFESASHQGYFFKILENMQKKLKKTEKQWYLAKGELMGSSFPLWRKKANILKGVGFNYEFADEEGGPKELKNGKDESFLFTDQPLLKQGDLLVTTGLDGIFPKGLHVALVTKVQDLRDEDYAYEIEAEPVFKNLDSLDKVFVLPPICRSSEPF